MEINVQNVITHIDKMENKQIENIIGESTGVNEIIDEREFECYLREHEDYKHYTQIEKFYLKYGLDWGEKFLR